MLLESQPTRGLLARPGDPVEAAEVSDGVDCIRSSEREICVEIYSEKRRVAVHEAGHGAMGYVLGWPFVTISIESHGDCPGRTIHEGMPCSEQAQLVDDRTRAWIDDQVMILRAGEETERAWIPRTQGAPADWEDRLQRDAAHDYGTAARFLRYVYPPEEVKVQIEQARQRVLDYVGRADGEASKTGRFWRLVEALAGAVQAAGTITWVLAEPVLIEADHSWHDGYREKMSNRD